MLKTFLFFDGHETDCNYVGGSSSLEETPEKPENPDFGPRTDSFRPGLCLLFAKKGYCTCAYFFRIRPLAFF